MDFKIQNMVGSCDVKFPIRLEGLVLTHGKFSRLVKSFLYVRLIVNTDTKKQDVLGDHIWRQMTGC